MAAFSSKGQVFPYMIDSSYKMIPYGGATQQADVYKKTAPSFADSPLVNQFLPDPAMNELLPSVQPGFGKKETPEPMAKDKSNLAYMLIALGGALRGDKNFIQNTMAIKKSQTEKERREAQKKRYEEALASAEPGSSTYNLIKNLGPEGIVQSTIESFRLEGAKTKAQSDLLVKLAEEGRAEVRTLTKEERAEARQIEKEERAEGRKKTTKGDIESMILQKVLAGEELTEAETNTLETIQRLDPTDIKIKRALSKSGIKKQPQQQAMETFPSLQSAQAAGLKKGDRFIGTDGQIYQVP